MKYTLITKAGKVMQFYVEDTARLYQFLNGGVLMSDQNIGTEVEPCVVPVTI